MHFFKHSTDMSTKLEVQKLINEFGAEGYGYYIMLIELIVSKMHQRSSEVEIFLPEIHAKVGIKFRKKLLTFLEKLTDFRLTFWQLSGNFVKFDLTKTPELKDFCDPQNIELRIKNKELRIKNLEEYTIIPSSEPNGSSEEIIVSAVARKSTKKEAQKNEQQKKQIPPKEKNHPKFENEELLKPFLNLVNKSSIDSWLNLYNDDEFILAELKKGAVWIESNPQSAPKSNYSGFFARWLTKAWDQHRKGLKSNLGPSKKNVDFSDPDYFFKKQRDENPFREDSNFVSTTASDIFGALK